MCIRDSVRTVLGGAGAGLDMLRLRVVAGVVLGLLSWAGGAAREVGVAGSVSDELDQPVEP